MNTSNPAVGFAGLGVMGRPMASHLVRAGYAMTLHDSVAGRAAEIAATLEGAVAVDVAARRERDRRVEPWLTEVTGARLGEIGVAMMDEPVSGAEWGAQAAELVFMCGGAAADLQRALPLLDCMGQAVFHLGPLGAATR